MTIYSFISVRFTTASRKPCSQQEFTSLETFRQLLPDGLLDHARSGKSDQRAGLCDIQIAEHREARRHAAGGRVGQNADVGYTCLVQPHQSGADLGQSASG